MADLREIELKLRFDDEEAFTRLLARLCPEGPPAPIAQTNHFIDTSDRRLRQVGIGWRLREAVRDGALRWILTLKGPTAPRDAPRDPDAEPSVLSVKLEEEKVIDAADARAMLEHPTVEALERLLGGGVLTGRVKAALGEAAPAYVGAFTNQRYPIPFVHEGFSGEIELDRTVFPGDVVHHELELEVTAAWVERAPLLEQELRSLIEAAGASASPSRGKASRFFDAIAGLPV